MERKVIIIRGLPASGKSTLSKKMVSESNGSMKRINNDDLRAMLDCNLYNANNEKFIKIIVSTMITQSLINGFSVVIDNLNLSEKNIRRIDGIVNKYNKGKRNSELAKLEIIDMDTPFDVCLERNSKRPKETKVPYSIMCDLNNTFFTDMSKKGDIVSVSNDNKTYYDKLFIDIADNKRVLCLEGTILTEWYIKK